MATLVRMRLREAQCGVVRRWVLGIRVSRAAVSILQRSLDHEALLQVHACALECHVVGLLGRVHHGGGVLWA